MGLQAFLLPLIVNGGTIWPVGLEQEYREDMRGSSQSGDG